MKKIGLNLYSLRDYCKTEADLDVTLGKVKAAGYPAVQVSGVGPIEPRAIKALLDKHGLLCCACHERLPQLRDDFKGIVSKLKTLDCGFTAIGSPGREMTTPEALPGLIKELEDYARRFKAEGLKFGYHNHAYEFEWVNGKPVLESIYAGAPTLLAEVDTHWVQFGGGDPTAWVRRVAGRMPVIHCKDYAIVGNEKYFAEVGHGNLDWASILKACKDTGVEWYVVEQDNPMPGRDIFTSVKMSYGFLAARV